MSRTDSALPPYAVLLGIVIDTEAVDGKASILRMDFIHALEGRPGILHGGATAGLLEMAANIALAGAQDKGGNALRVKPIGITIDYMRPGLPHPTFARGRVRRVGSRVATVIVEAWQSRESEPIAVARMHMLLRGHDDDADAKTDVAGLSQT